jgi:hypothetical protein
MIKNEIIGMIDNELSGVDSRNVAQDLAEGVLDLLIERMEKRPMFGPIAIKQLKDVREGRI